jgi:hypothetical protein
MHHRRTTALDMAILLIVAAGCLPTSSPSVPPVTPGSVTVYAAGDIASCDSNGDEATADLVDRLLAKHDGSVLALGDLAYEAGSASDFEHCYDPSWGRFLGRTLPTPGNHEYETPDTSAYFDYFADVETGDPAEGWYDRQLVRGWWLISLNSNCDEVGGCESGSAQMTYLSDTLDRIATETPETCILAIWHHPRWSSGDEHGSDPRTDALWRALADAGADVVLSGHDHAYERFVPMDASGAPAAGGTTEFVVGTGGRSLYGFGDILPTSAAHDNSTFGVLKLTLREGSYDWRFVPTRAGGFSDTGSASCSSTTP